MTASQKRVERGVKLGGVSLARISVSPGGVEGVVVPDTVINDDFARRANNLDVEAAYYRHRAIQEEQALGPGYHVGPIREMAPDRAVMAQPIRTQSAAS